MSDAASEGVERARVQPPFPKFLGVSVVEITPERTVAELTVAEHHTNRNGTLHGGVVMALADNMGGTATVANLPLSKYTTTIESKTNFFATVALGDTVRAECTPLHRGRTTMVWQTKLTRGDGKLVAIVTQTQMVLGG